MTHDQIINSFIDKIITLEKRLGSNANFLFYQPVEFNKNDIISLQKLAKHMANFVGLSKLVFTITIATQKKNTAGHIESSGDDVFIEIDPNVIKSKDAILCVLAHEISHEILSRNNIQDGLNAIPEIRRYENEVLTDITAIYMGFGKQVLNGCKIVINTANSHYQAGYGYISREQFAFIYLIISNMRKIDKNVYMHNINHDAKETIESVLCKNNDYFTSKLHDISYNEKIEKKLQADVTAKRNELEKIEKDITYIRDCLNESEKQINNSFSKINKNQNTFLQSLKSSSSNPSLQFLFNIKKRIKYNEIIAKPIFFESKIPDFIQSLRKIVNYIYKIYNVSSSIKKEYSKNIVDRYKEKILKIFKN